MRLALTYSGLGLSFLMRPIVNVSRWTRQASPDLEFICNSKGVSGLWGHWAGNRGETS